VRRDFTDVPPNTCVFRGRGRETISVRVETRTLDFLPSLTWRDELPPLPTPLTAIIRPPQDGGDEAAQGQQQQ
jgi:hypothetical protein